MNRISCLLVLTLAAACGGSGSSQVALSARAGTAASTAATAAGQQSQPLDLGNGIILTHLRVVLSEVKLEGTASTDAGTTGDEVEFKTAPMLLDLAGASLDNGTTQQITISDVKAGTYREIKFKIHKLSSSDPGVASDAALAAMASHSIIVDGTIDGTAFTFTSAVDAQQQAEGTFNFGDGSHAMTLNLDASTWFGGTGASRLDPRVGGNQSAIENNIQKSFKAFQDDDHNGREDHS
ncbi:MAG: hypothetical protein E6J61_11675 [Deltaproteobacteria bacterium]|nr:MAG: hypothetical protein E6J61_11675 [Deltaproteobacteria bacterium]